MEMGQSVIVTSTYCLSSNKKAKAKRIENISETSNNLHNFPFSRNFSDCDLYFLPTTLWIHSYFGFVQYLDLELEM